MYDVTRRETLDAIGRYWLPEAERNGTYPDAVKMIMANKIDMVRTRVSEHFYQSTSNISMYEGDLPLCCANKVYGNW